MSGSLKSLSVRMFESLSVRMFETGEISFKNLNSLPGFEPASSVRLFALVACKPHQDGFVKRKISSWLM